MKLFTKFGFIAMVLAVIAATDAVAQGSEQRITINLTPAFATVGGDTEAAVAGSIGYRFTERLSFEGDFTWVDAAAGGVRDREFSISPANVTIGNVNDALGRISGLFGGNNNRGDNRLPSFNLRGIPNLPIQPIGIGGFSASTDGQTMIGTLGVRYEPMVQTARFRPYLSGGFGMNHTEQEFTLASATTATTSVGNTRVVINSGAVRTGTFDESTSHSGFALSAGGGANFRLFKSVWANADAKFFRLSRDRNLVRLGGGVGFRF
jgi:hypothetical protein